MTELESLIDDLVRPIEDWPEPGVTFRDITPLLGDPAAYGAVIDGLVALAEEAGPVDAILGIEARGFLFGPSIALRLGVGFVPVRKLGKLPADLLSTSYDLEYGSSTLEMHVDALAPGARVLVVDDVLATGGTMMAAADLVSQAGGVVVGNLVLIELLALGGRERLAPIRCSALRSY
ncbi:adenine phosphoribosyltransferase [Aeromicrobium wangtongii]|uniref:Adenine phosphoribosyltransferase n=1 Tax=Aeromicrobium wangtongii TaxID=2969247 RepID=A0ABY5M206_9ACTN|nr:adenine phosphoribosyltransferase [Aeromicrobium wangtongii]MCD9198193.1 adenine phosphoribosyltransferase [Aeromicrobium wangtongii]MCL3819089.1 adenine phosphoribosyltransferase [Aeromicrobium wangtongii]UUP12229.1 adenine phosphoribosyltransferase [Aeromicrobium wangtongii]